MADTWGNDPVQTAAAPDAGSWGNDPVAGTSKFRFSDAAIQKSVSKPGQSTVWLHPAQYLALVPDLPDTPRTDKKGSALKVSLAGGNEVEEIPTLHMTVGKDGTGKIIDQNGRQRAMAAQASGVDLIPVAITRDGDKVPVQHVLGMREGSQPIEYDFPSVAPKPVQAPKPKAGFVAGVKQGLKDPFVGLGQLEAHGVEAVAKGGEALGVLPKGTGAKVEGYVAPRDAAVDQQEAEYQAARRENAGGKEPGFDYGRLTGNVVNPINALPLGEASAVARAGFFAKRAEPVITGLVRSIAKAGASTGSGGAVLAALNPVTGGDFWDEKTKQAATGLAVGTVVPPVFRAGSTALIKGGAATIAPLVNWMAGVKGPNAAMTAAEKEIMRRLSQGTAGGGPTAQDMLDLASANPGKPLTLMDVGSQPVNALAGRVARAPGPGGQVVRDFLRDRTDAQGQRLEGDINSKISPQKSYGTTQAMMQSRANAAAPLYKEAYEKNQNIASPMIDKILETPAGKTALADARVQMKNDMAKMGIPDAEIAEQMREAGDIVPKGGVASGLKLRTLDYVKRALYDQEAAERKGGRENAANTIKDLRKTMVSEIDKVDATAEKPLPEKDFYKQYVQHTDIRGRQSGKALETRDAILKDGFKKGANVNSVDPYRGGKPTNAVDAKYGAPKKGDVVYLAPKGAWKDAPNGREIQNGWKPQAHEAIVIKDPSKSMYENYVESFAKNAKPGQYAQARAAFSGPSQSMEAIEFGKSALKPKMGTDELKAEFDALNPNDQEFARIGLAQALREHVVGKDVGTNSARKMSRNRDVQQRIGTFFKSKADFDKFMKSVDAEDIMFKTDTDVLGGSRTRERMAEDEGADANALAHAAHAGIHLSGGNVLGAGSSLWRAITEYAKRPNPELAHEMSKLLTAPLDQHASSGMKLLRDFAAVAPGTRNYLAQAQHRAAGIAPATIVPGVQATRPNSPQP